MPSSAAPVSPSTLSLHDALPISIASVVLGNNDRPLLLIDVSELDKSYSVLSAALPVQGRAVTIYAEVHPKKGVDSVAVRNGFLEVDRKSTRLNSSHLVISYAVFCCTRLSLHAFPTRRSSDLHRFGSVGQ